LYEATRLAALKELQETEDNHSKPDNFKILKVIQWLRQFCCNPKMVLSNSAVESSKLEAFREIMEELLIFAPDLNQLPL